MTAPSQDTQSVDVKVDLLLQKLTLREKISLLSGKDDWQTVPIERLNIPSITMTDGPHGVRANRTGPKRDNGPATSFPTGVSMAATWNPELIEQVGEALGEETRAMGCEILLGPCVNIVRTPLAGRNFESYSEDPFLAGHIGTAWIKGLQRQKIGASLKHYACNNQEIERSRGNSIVDERTLREIYLAQFEMIVKAASPWTVMCSYNRVNGVYASQHDTLLNTILKDEWGFEGAVVSDWGANHTIFESVAGGLDIEMPGPALYYGRFLEDAVNNWQIDESHIDDAARRVLRMIILSGKMDQTPLPQGSVNTKAHQTLARLVAEESITLLKNTQKVLPIRDEIKSIAVIGPNADECRIGGGGSSYLEPPYRVSPLEALQTKLGNKVELKYEKGCDNHVNLPALKTEYLTTPDGSTHGLVSEFFNNQELIGSPAATRIDEKIDDWRILLPEGINTKAFSVRWLACLSVPVGGQYLLALDTPGICRLFLNDELILSTDPEGQQAGLSNRTFVQLNAEHGYALRVEYIKTQNIDSTSLYVRAAYAPDPDNRFERAVSLAKTSDMVLFFGGMPTGWESEGSDRPHMKLTGEQDKLISALAAANPNTVVVLNCGSPVEMPWVDEVKAIMLAYYPGQEGGNAICNVLNGTVNPSGKLTITFPQCYMDNPSYINYPGTKDVIYGEGLFVGYRYYDMKDVEPLFPFGHGLSYTTFTYSDLTIAPDHMKGEKLNISVVITNTGECAGKEVVQLYIHDKESSLIRPIKELKGFRKVDLEPGESKTLKFNLAERDLAFYDPYQKMWVAEQGAFEVLIGSSSREIVLRKEFNLT